MNNAEITEMLDILRGDKRCYYHYEHGNVHLLVSRWREQFNTSPFHQARGKLATVADFRARRYGRWQHLPLIKQWLAGHGGRNAVLDPLPHLGLIADKNNKPASPMGYAITFDKWGSEDKADIWWNQTSRVGYNLVLQWNSLTVMLMLHWYIFISCFAHRLFHTVISTTIQIEAKPIWMPKSLACCFVSLLPMPR